MLNTIATYLAQTDISLWIATREWFIPWVQTIHIVAICFAMISALLLDMRVMGLLWNDQSLQDTAGRFLPWVWWSVVVLALTGSLLVLGEPARELLDWTFQIKLVLVAVTLLLTSALSRMLRSMAPETKASSSQRAFAILSAALWISIAVCGRWIAYTTSH